MTKRLEQFSKKEAERRFSAAIQGAFKTSPKPLKSMTRKRAKSKGAKSSKKI